MNQEKIKRKNSLFSFFYDRILVGDYMKNMKFTKAFIPNEKKFEEIDTLSEVKRLERIHDNMSGVNPFTKEKEVAEQEKRNDFNNLIDSQKNIKKD